jgi:hypothetical protein
MSAYNRSEQKFDSESNLQEQARLLLSALSSDWGIQASLSEEGNYQAVFTRDAVLAGIAGILLDDEQLIDALKRSLNSLKEHAGPHGQIASNITFGANGVEHISYGTLCPKWDSIGWYVLACSLLILKKGGSEAWLSSVEKALQCYDILEYNNSHLIYIPAGGNWADEYPYEGYILHDQALRALALKFAARAFDRSDWTRKSEDIITSIRNNYIADGSVEKALQKRIYQQQKKEPYLAMSFNPVGYQKGFDLASQLLFALLDDQIIWPQTEKFIRHTFLDHNKLVPAFHPSFNPGEAGWDQIKNFYLYVFKNEPGHYHNGGCWIIWQGYLYLILQKSGFGHSAAILKELLLKSIFDLSSFAFEEYLDGINLNAAGTRHMAYSATGIRLLENPDWSILS